MKNILKLQQSKYGLLTVVGMSLLCLQSEDIIHQVKAEEIEEFEPVLVYDTLTPKVWRRIEEIVPSELQYMWPEDDPEVTFEYSNKTVIEFGINDNISNGPEVGET